MNKPKRKVKEKRDREDPPLKHTDSNETRKRRKREAQGRKDGKRHEDRACRKTGRSFAIVYIWPRLHEVTGEDGEMLRVELT